MTNKSKWLMILVCFVLLLLLTGFGFKKAPGKGGRIASADDLKGASLVGVSGRMPDNSAAIFFRSLTGRKLGRYKGLKNMDECLYALKNGSADVIWTTDVTADYLIARDETLGRLDTSDMAAIENTVEPRFSFGMAAADTEKGRELIGQIDDALDYIRGDGILDTLTVTYIDRALDESTPKFTQKDMVVNDSIHKVFYRKNKVLKVGVTGAVPPVELLDENGKPYGFCVALMDEVAQILQRRVKFIVLDNETAFSSLQKGRVDIIFSYGAGRVTTESARGWVMSEGYLDVQKYDFIYIK